MSSHRPSSTARRARRLGQAAPRTPTKPETSEAPQAGTSAFNQVAKAFGSIVAPTTLFTALLYYFGWDHTYYLYNYFGVHSTVLGLSTSDYLMHSVDALFIPVSITATGSLLTIWAHAEIRSRLPAGSRPRPLRVALPVMAATGSLLTAAGLASAFSPALLSGYLYDTAAPLSLIAGILLLTYTNHLRRAYPGDKPPIPQTADTLPWTRPAEWTVVFTLVSIGLFWAATNYAADVGTGRARQILAELPSYPSAVLYSKNSLNLTVPGIRETRCQDRQGTYPFRYDGLVLILQSGNQYLFLPRRWNPATSSAILLPRGDTVRLEFSPNPYHGAGSTITC